MNNDNPTELKREDVDRFVESIMSNEIKSHQCIKCSKNYILDSYGHHIGECDECWFSRFAKDQVKEFFRSFFE